MDKGLMIRILGFALIPLCVYGAILLILRGNEKEETSNLHKERIVVRPPKIMGWAAIIEMLFCTAVIFIMFFFPNGTEASFVFLGFSLLDLLGAYFLWATLIWQIEVFRNEDFFILRDYWGRKHKIHYSDCTSYQYRYQNQEIIVRNRIKNFTISYLLVNCGVLIAALRQHNVKREKDR